MGEGEKEMESLFVVEGKRVEGLARGMACTQTGMAEAQHGGKTTQGSGLEGNEVSGGRENLVGLRKRSPLY